MPSVSKERIRALITLLGDESGEIRSIARERLLQIGEPAADLLHRVADADEEGRVRIEAHNLLEKIRIDALGEAFSRLGQRPSSRIDLEEGVLLIAEFADPELDRNFCVGQLDALGEEARERLAGIHDPQRRLLLLNHVLFVEHGFHGNTESYYDPDNSYLNRVLERRVGIPISLSVVYMLVGSRAGLSVQGVGMPGHFICKARFGEQSFFVDPFNCGEILTYEHCLRYLRRSGYGYEPSHLSIVTHREILMRMLRNLILLHTQKGEERSVDILSRFYEAISQ